MRGARLLEPAFEAHAGRQGRLSIQTDPTHFGSAERMLAQASHFESLAPNVIVKFPATSAGLVGIEEATARGISVNVTVCFSVAQALAAAAAIERGLRRREADGQPIDRMGPVVTLMMGRIEDWLRRPDGTGRDRGRPGRPALVRGRRLQAGLRALPRTRDPGPAAGRRDPPPLPLVGADRRRRRHHPAGRLAATVQRLDRGGPAADGRSGRPSHHRGAFRQVPGLRARLRARRPAGEPSSTPSRRPSGRFAPSSPRTTSCSTW